MLESRNARVALTTLLLALPLAAGAQSETRLVEKYESFAGSDVNAKSLVEGLREAKQITLSDGKTTSTFTPPTRKMGDGNVNIALALAEAKLKATQGKRNKHLNPERVRHKRTSINNQQSIQIVQGFYFLENIFQFLYFKLQN